MQRPVVAALKARAAGLEARAPRAGEQSQARLLSSGEAPRPRRRTHWLLERISSARHHVRGCRAARSRGPEPYRAAPGSQGAHVPCACLQTITGKVKCKCFPATARHRTGAPCRTRVPGTAWSAYLRSKEQLQAQFLDMTMLYTSSLACTSVCAGAALRICPAKASEAPSPETCPSTGLKLGRSPVG